MGPGYLAFLHKVLQTEKDPKVSSDSFWKLLVWRYNCQEPVSFQFEHRRPPGQSVFLLPMGEFIVVIDGVGGEEI